MIIYLDQDYRCHIEKAPEFREIETDVFEGKCKAFIEGYRFIPENEVWKDEKGDIFSGEAYFPAVPYSGLELEQLRYELADAKAALAVLGVSE